MRKVVLLLVMVINIFAFSFFDAKPENQCNRVDYLVIVKDLIVATQKTRGLTNSFQNGNVVAQLLVYGQRTEMKKALRKLVKYHKKSTQIVDKKTKARVDTLAKQIKALNKSAFKMQSQDAFDAYTHVINEMLLITQNMIKVNCTTCEPLAQEAVVMMVNTLLPLTENIGKMRGLGAGVVARGYAKKEESKKLKGFIREIQKLNIKMGIEMTQLTNHYPKAFSNSIQIVKKNLDAAIAQYVALVKEKIIGKKDITLDANNYFDEGSAAISKVLELYTMNRESIRNAK